NIIPTYDLNQDETGSPFFVMKKIEGVSLEDILKGRRNEFVKGEFSRRRLIDIFLQVCHAIEYAHSRGIFHLDLKPANIVIGKFGEVYVLDWGFAAKKDEEQKYIAGTPIYIAPERMRAQQPDARSDIYSLGVMLYRSLVKELPRNVGKMTFREYRKEFENLPIIPPRERDSSIPRDLEAIVLKAMADSPGERYQTIGELVEDVNRFLDILPVSAYESGVFGRLWKFVNRHRAATITVSSVCLALMVAGVFFWRSHISEVENQAYRERILKRVQARIPFEKATDLVDQLRGQVEKELSTDKSATLEKSRAAIKPALDLFAEAIEINPSDAEAYYELGKAYYLVRDTDKALQNFRKAYELDESYIMAHYYAGTILADAYKRHAEAQKEFEAMQLLDKNNEFSELGQARVDLAQMQYDRALERCRRIETLNPALPDFWYVRGLVHQMRKGKGDLAAALDAYDEYIKRRQDNPSAFLNRGDIHKDLGDYDAAISDYRAALSVQPDYKWALNNLGYVLYYFKEQPNEGLRYIEEALKVDDQDLFGYLNRAAIFEALKKVREAEDDYRRALWLAPDNPIVHYRMAVYLLRQERLDESEKYLNQAIKLLAKQEKLPRQSTLSVWIHRRGIVRLAKGEYADAVRDFEESIRLRGQNKIYPGLMRWVAMKLADGEPIDKSDFEKSLVVSSDSPWLAAVGAYYMGDLSDRAAARAEVLSLADTPKAKCEAYFYLGAYSYAMGDNAAASADFRSCVGTGVHLSMEYTLSWILLRKIEANNASLPVETPIK
ncbi:MAG: tetratricopeptide repeat protein, partial [Planctomycetes bacterium]|nr:tetratricopeptide repeat protein [Planctomycetota bacterium]